MKTINEFMKEQKTTKLFVFAYDTEEDVREKVITFLNENGGKEIKQCLRSNYTFKSGNDVVWWNGKIKNNLSLDYYQISEVKLGERTDDEGSRFFEIKKKCNSELQMFVDDTLK